LDTLKFERWWAIGQAYPLDGVGALGLDFLNDVPLPGLPPATRQPDDRP
jgi:hypothetical protein